MKKTKVVIASVLKPIDDTRMLEKFGFSLAETNEYDINIIGFDSKNVVSTQDISYHPIKPFNRLSFARLLGPWKVYKTYIKVKPKIIVFNTHELLIVTCLYKILFGCKIVYDIRENYAKNITSTTVFPRVLRPFLAAWVRTKEWCSRPFIIHYILAERIYEKQLPFLSNKTTIIENKYAPGKEERTAYRNLNPVYINLTYTGTIGASNGIFEAIEITKKLHELNQNVRLKIVGYCALKRDLIRLKEEIQDHDFIELNGGDHLVPHSEIIEAIQKSDFGFILKKANNGMNDQKLLTRLFEYTANKLPILLLNNPTWVEFCDQFNAAIVVDPENFQPDQILEAMVKSNFYDRGDSNSSLWKNEESKLVELVAQLK